MTQQAIRCGSFSGVKEPTRKIHALVEHYHAQACPFAWIVTADSILCEIERPCSFISRTRHRDACPIE